MSKPETLIPAQGSRIVRDESGCILFGQPPEVLKGLLLNNITSFDTLVLTDIKEKDGSLQNNLEFPIYFFLFVARGLEEGRKLNLVGTNNDISQALRLMRYTLMGPTRGELDDWGTGEELKKEWLEVASAIAIKDGNGETIPVEGFFNLCPYEDDEARAGTFTIKHLDPDSYQVNNAEGSVNINLNQDEEIDPPYAVQNDYVPGGLVKLGVEILGGASGFTPNEPCTGLALCYNGDYILIDSIPFLDQHLVARGISKNQVSACFLTHLHDDHCAMFPLMLMPHQVEIITTREIFTMAMEKLACSLGWSSDVVAEHFTLVEVVPGESFNYYGLSILPHVTVHSIPTIGATFTSIHRGYERQICIVGDNNTMTTIREMNEQGIVRDETLNNLDRIYTQRFSLLVADGGAGEIHGDPADALKSDADRVVFVHVEHLPNEFDTTFSLASSGKRYTVLEGDPSLYTSQVNHYLTHWLGEPFPNRWMRSLLAEEEIRKYNSDDVIIVQDSETKGFVYLILTGYCEVVQHDGKQFHTVARLQAGDVIGEMAIVTGVGIRNASVVARTPVTVCVFAEETFAAFIEAEGFRDKLINRWNVRPLVKSLPQFREMTSTVLERLSNIARFEYLDKGDARRFDESAWYILAEGTVEDDEGTHSASVEYGWIPFAESNTGPIVCLEDCRLIKFRKEHIEAIRHQVPQINYYLRKQRIGQENAQVSWLLEQVETQ
jgi:CRP-like cAMP-binding protein|tara:strand:+ start:8764 stop:10923 length:2160 start_codon:yes stop_codon:yes gene_type:complete